MSKSHDRFIIRSFYTSIFTSAKQQSKATMTLPMHIRRARARTRRRHLHNTHTWRALQCWLAAGRTQYQRIHDLVTDHGVCWVWRQKKWMRAENDSIEWANVIITITWIFFFKILSITLLMCSATLLIVTLLCPSACGCVWHRNVRFNLIHYRQYDLCHTLFLPFLSFLNPIVPQQTHLVHVWATSRQQQQQKRHINNNHQSQFDEQLTARCQQHH